MFQCLRGKRRHSMHVLKRTMILFMFNCGSNERYTTNLKQITSHVSFEHPWAHRPKLWKICNKAQCKQFVDKISRYRRLCFIH